jgi:lipoprotein-anchoring transpeptidase ErfK/SrfK
VKRPAHLAAAAALAVCGLIGFAAAFGLVTNAGAQTTTTTTTTSSEPPPTSTTTTTATTTTPPPTQPPPPPRPAPIPFGVTVGGIQVGGLLPAKATRVVERSFGRPLRFVVDDTTAVTLEPSALGAEPKIDKAIRRARVARPGATIPLDVAVARERIRAYVDRLARRFDREPRDAKLVLQGLRPRALPSQIGRQLRLPATGLAIRKELATNVRAPIRLSFVIAKPEVRSVEFKRAIVIMRGSNRLLLYGTEKLIRTFQVATGQPAYPTPLGTYEIVNKQRDPWWYPPPSKWAQNSDPVPPGPGNPLGTRWMGLSAPYVGIHGTPDAASIGYSASHGCVRMRIPDAEWLFQHVDLGTPVFIIPR